MEKLHESAKITNPKDVFAMQISDASREAMKNQIEVHLHLIDVGLRKGQFQMIKQKI